MKNWIITILLCALFFWWAWLNMRAVHALSEKTKAIQFTGNTEEVQASGKKAPEEILPYKFAQVDKGTLVYKGVHEGCEYYIATSLDGYGNAQIKTVSIALGRGCK